MNKTIYVILSCAILLMLPPVILLTTGWNWSPSQDVQSIKWLFWLTETAGLPYSIITSVILLGITLYVCRPETKIIVKWVVIIICCILVGQGLKGIIKNSVKEPRPYVVWLEKEYGIANLDFYDLNRKERVELIKNTVKHSDQIPPWQRKHWQAETGYSFPSGHVLFAAGWALLLIGLFWQRRQYALVVIMVIWSECIVFSRILLGMHWPVDVIVSITISAILAIAACRLLQNKVRITKQA
ncbi:phosphatidylglycerophosphatase B [Providencia burhodogranariea]|uniref:undecaprenyl-diphosphate phosphatase n=1 Tax=Providencia burhodogranariea DSM 19968 TaxID=1141662 RepID=K8X233_9GAMM|nr:phosphatidylglycerophosphatase B [Providencia burhodogranariea]EKT63737.1 phosphatidylglycerophosphatase B [Providencia burhodogranariea DSM 19968]